VLTATLRKSYEVALMAVNQKWPILLYGPVGAGKTALINKLAQIGGNRGICFLFYNQYKLRYMFMDSARSILCKLKKLPLDE
jgi:midasin (ATPase involved in ribosome maturation)